MPKRTNKYKILLGQIASAKDENFLLPHWVR